MCGLLFWAVLISIKSSRPIKIAIITHKWNSFACFCIVWSKWYWVYSSATNAIYSTWHRYWISTEKMPGVYDTATRLQLMIRAFQTAYKSQSPPIICKAPTANRQRRWATSRRLTATRGGGVANEWRWLHVLQVYMTLSTNDHKGIYPWQSQGFSWMTQHWKDDVTWYNVANEWSLGNRIQWKYVYPLRAKFFRGNTNIYLHFMTLLHIDVKHVLKILPRVRPGPTYST